MEFFNNSIFNIWNNNMENIVKKKEGEGSVVNHSWQIILAREDWWKGFTPDFIT